MLTAILFTVGVANAQTDPKLNRRLKAQIAKVRKLKTSLARFNAADQLDEWTFDVDPTLISKSTVRALVTLLDDSDDAVRLFAAGALGNIQARSAIPKMLVMLPMADYIPGPITSGEAIRAALSKMEVPLPPRPSYAECHGPK